MNVYHFHCPDTPPPNYTSSSDRIGFESLFFSTSSLVRILSLCLKLEGGNYILALLSFGRTDNLLLFICMAASICAPRYRFPPMSLSPRQDGQLFCTERRTEQSPAYWRGGKLCFFQAHCVAVAGLEMAEGRVCEKWNRIPLALFNLNLKGTFHLLCAAPNYIVCVCLSTK